MGKLKITSNFSRYADLYDKYADVQNKAAAKLLSSLKSSKFLKILELGCGTGNYTLMLRERFKDASIKAWDISDEMIKVAKGKLKDKSIEFIVADAERVIATKEFDLITSNACFQWLNNLDQVLQGYAKSLCTEGTVCFSIFGPQTFYELNTVLKATVKDSPVAADYFCNRDKLKVMLEDNFKSVKIDEGRYRERFGNLKGLLEKIKYSGVRGNGLSKKVYFSRGLFEQLEKSYLDKFQGIYATYQVFFCRGEKR